MSSVLALGFWCGYGDQDEKGKIYQLISYRPFTKSQRAISSEP
jgi:hypothetical protein